MFSEATVHTCNVCGKYGVIVKMLRARVE